MPVKFLTARYYLLTDEKPPFTENSDFHVTTAAFFASYYKYSNKTEAYRQLNYRQKSAFVTK